VLFEILKVINIIYYKSTPIDSVQCLISLRRKVFQHALLPNSNVLTHPRALAARSTYHAKSISGFYTQTFYAPTMVCSWYAPYLAPFEDAGSFKSRDAL